MPIPKYKRQANDKYNAKCDRLSCRPLLPVGAAIRAAAAAAGQSVQAYILDACLDRMKREGQPLEINTPDEQK